MYAFNHVISTEHTMSIRYDFGSANTGNGSKFIYNTDDDTIFNPVPLHVAANPNYTDQDTLGIITFGDGDDIIPKDNRPFPVEVTQSATTESEEPEIQTEP